MKFYRTEIDTAERTRSRPIESLIDELDRAVRMIASVDDISYRRKTKASSSVGAQFRHDLDFIDLFLNGIELGRVDYTARKRDIRTENDRAEAIARIQDQKVKIKKLRGRSLLSGISVRSEIDGEMWMPSSVLRELEFVHSHTVHHHALIAEKLLGLGIQVEEEFGVAPSTLLYWNKQAA